MGWNSKQQTASESNNVNMSVTTRSMAKIIAKRILQTIPEEKEEKEDDTQSVSLGSQDTAITEESDGTERTEDSYEEDGWIVKAETKKEAESKCMCEDCRRMRW